MIRILVILSLTVWCLSSPEVSLCQSASNGKTYLLKKHSVSIIGHTNVNKFTCKLELDNVRDTLHVQEERRQNYIEFEGLDFKLPIDQFRCGNPMMNADLRSLLRYKEHPFLELQLTRIEFGEPSKGGDTGAYTINAHITIADVTRTEIFKNSQIENEGSRHLFQGSHSLLLTNYQIEPPKKFFGTVQVKDKIDIEFEIHLYDSSE